MLSVPRTRKSLKAAVAAAGVPQDGPAEVLPLVAVPSPAVDLGELLPPLVPTLEPDANGDVEGDPSTWPAWVDEDRWELTEDPAPAPMTKEAPR
jgi:hypothetical protein